MPRPVRLPLSRRLVGALAILALPVQLGCVSGVTHDDEARTTLEECGNAVTGSRYTVCGKVTSAGFSAPGASVTVRGSIDAAPQPVGSRYAIQGGSFHVSR